jgi:glycosyltransferase involved in cell wall biosynthesis
MAERPHSCASFFDGVTRALVCIMTDAMVLLMRSFSVVIPTYNMCGYLPELWQSMVDSGLAERADAIVVVNDGSTDDSRAWLDRCRESSPLARRKLRPLHLRQNQGRYRARMQGAESVVSEDLLFLDSRLTLPRNFAQELAAASERYGSIVGSVDIDTARSNFCLYWDRSHRAIFRHHFAHADQPITLTSKNFDEFLKGTGVFLCDRKLFLDACAHFAESDLLSDDTFLMKKMVEHAPITVHPDVRVGWVPRESYREFIWRIWDRGPGFVEYHVFERRSGLFFWATIALAIGFLSWICVVCVAPPVGAGLVVVGAAAAALSTAWFATSPKEFVALAPLHVGVTGAFAAGALRGIFVNSKRKAPALLQGARAAISRLRTRRAVVSS